MVDPSFVDLQVGKKVFSLRQEHQLAEADVAATLGLSPADYVLRESGQLRFTPAQIKELARIFNVNAVVFFADVMRADDRGGANDNLDGFGGSLTRSVDVYKLFMD